MENCIFCKIVKGEIPSVRVWEDDKYLTIMDVNPINPGHVLLIPKSHEEYIFDLEDKNYSDLMIEAKKIAKKIKEKLNPKRVGMAIEGFGVPHIHIHLVPINHGNELNPENAKPSTQKELEEIAKVLNQ
jgi:histidine triad (HIT) family protein